MKLKRTASFAVIACSVFASLASADTRMFHATNHNEALACRDAQNHALRWLNENNVAITASRASTEQSKCDCVGDPQQGYTCTVEVRITRQQ